MGLGSSLLPYRRGNSTSRIVPTNGVCMIADRTDSFFENPQHVTFFRHKFLTPPKLIVIEYDLNVS